MSGLGFNFNTLQLTLLHYMKLQSVFCPESALAPLARIFFRWRIKNPLDGPAGASVFSLN